MDDEAGAVGADPYARLLHHLEQPREHAPLGDDEVAQLVVYAMTCWSDWWASKVLDWVEQGVWNENVAAAVRQASQDRRYSQETRHRAWRRANDRGLDAASAQRIAELTVYATEGMTQPISPMSW
jgi:hypothetical protein